MGIRRFLRQALRPALPRGPLGLGALGALAVSLIGGPVPAGAAEPTAGSCVDAAAPGGPEEAGVRRGLADHLESGFGVQYWGTGFSPEALARAPHGVLIIEATRDLAPDGAFPREKTFTAQDIRAMRREGRRPVLGYVNLTEIETYRDYWARTFGRADAADSLTPDRLPDWYAGRTKAGERLAAYWSPAWAEILEERVDRLLALGLDGIFLDDLLHYFTWASGEGLERLKPADLPGTPADAAGYARAMMDLVRRIADRAHARRCGAVVIVNNGVFIGGDAGAGADPDATAAFEAYRGSLDAILVESMMAPALQAQATALLRQDYARAGLPVLAVEFASTRSDLSGEAFRAAVSEWAAQAGFVPYVADDQAFDRLYPPAIRRPPSAAPGSSP